MLKFIKKYKIPLTIITAIIVFILSIFLKYYLVSSSNTISLEDNSLEKEEIEVSSDSKTSEEPELVGVDIKGAVVNPGVYLVENTKRVIDVINEAGGFTANASTEEINLSKKVFEEMVIIVYTKEEVESNNFTSSVTNDALTTTNDNSSNSNTSPSNTKVNINTANLETLETLTGIGKSKAQSIIDYREQNGNFTSIEDIKKVSGIGDSIYEKIKDHITV